MEEIVVQNITKDFGNGRGIFDLSFSVYKGETFGFVGTNGSGKSTTIRILMGFIKPDSGTVKIRGLDAWKDASKIKEFTSYIPGEFSFPDLKTGIEFLKNQAEFQGQKDIRNAETYLKRLNLDPDASLKRMSKGTKQKTAIVSALMKDADILIFDEPTTGLDPLMRHEFLKIIEEEKSKGKTIFMSSQSFEELEQTCDRVALILDGKIVNIADINQLKNLSTRNYKIEFLNEEDYLKFKKLKFNIVRDQTKYNQVTVQIEKVDIPKLFKSLKKYSVKFISEVDFTLEKYFKDKLKLFKHSTQTRTRGKKSLGQKNIEHEQEKKLKNLNSAQKDKNPKSKQKKEVKNV